MKCWQVIETICQHIIIMLHTILVSTRNFVTARPRNNIFVLLPSLTEKSESDRSCPFVPKRSVKRWQVRIGLTRKGDPRKRFERPSTTKWTRKKFVSFPIQFITIILIQLLASQKAWLQASFPDIYEFGVASYSTPYLSRLPSSLSPFSFVYLLLTLVWPTHNTIYNSKEWNSGSFDETLYSNNFTFERAT